jgi:hypothetical protein
LRQRAKRDRELDPMAVIEVVTFRLAAGVDEGGFLRADQQAQTEFHYHQRGHLRRTTARSAGEDWLVVAWWRSSGDADAATEASRADPDVARWAEFLEPGTITTRRFETLD